MTYRLWSQNIDGLDCGDRVADWLTRRIINPDDDSQKLRLFYYTNRLSNTRYVNVDVDLYPDSRPFQNAVQVGFWCTLSNAFKFLSEFVLIKLALFSETVYCIVECCR